MRNIPWRITAILAFTLATIVAALPDAAAAQDKPTLGADDYDQWESPGQAVLSPDGRWLAVVVRRVDESSELRVHRTDADSVAVVSEGSRPEFGADGGWLAFAIGMSPRRARQAAGERGAGPERRGTSRPSDGGTGGYRSGAVVLLLR